MIQLTILQMSETSKSEDGSTQIIQSNERKTEEKRRDPQRPVEQYQSF